MISDWNLSLVLAIGELLADPQQPKALLEAKLYAFQQVKGLMCQYEKHGIREDPFSVPEEELALWAIVSPNNMLIPPAQERYMDLFTRVFGITREQLTNGPLPDVKLEVQ